jgi:hypothetical protein
MTKEEKLQMWKADVMNAVERMRDVETAANMVDSLMCEGDYAGAHNAVTILQEILESRLSSLQAAVNE